VKATKTNGGGDASPSYNPPRDCNIFSFELNFCHVVMRALRLFHFSAQEGILSIEIAYRR